MDFKIITFLAILAVTMQSGECVKCFICNSEANNECHDLRGNIISRECNINAIRDENPAFAGALEALAREKNDDPAKLAQQMVCHKGVTIDNGRKYTTRGCQISERFSGQNVCKVIRSELAKTAVKVYHCSICSSDDCNGSRALRSSAAVLLACVFAALLALMH